MAFSIWQLLNDEFCAINFFEAIKIMIKLCILIHQNDTTSKEKRHAYKNLDFKDPVSHYLLIFDLFASGVKSLLLQSSATL